MSQTIEVGQPLPQTSVKVIGKDGDMTDHAFAELFGHGRHVVFGVPGAFTPTCSAKHLPGYVAMAGEIKAKGVDSIACVAVNDGFVMRAWGEAVGSPEVTMIADGNGDLAHALGLEMDATGFGMGVRSRRFAMIIRDGKVEKLFVEPLGAFGSSGAENILMVL